RKPAVHGVAGFVRERVNIGKDVFLVIHQDVRRGAITPGRERAAALGLGFVTIAPAPAQTFGQKIDIFFSERRERSENRLDRFIKTDVWFNFQNERHVSSVMMKLIQAEDAPAE